jgi:PPOX class probable F420-dependent enzyme
LRPGAHTTGQGAHDGDVSEAARYVPPMIPESHLDLMAAPLTAIFASVDADGAPQSSAIWYMWEDGRLWFSTKRWAKKYRNLADRPLVSFIVVDPTDEFRYVEIRGRATVAEDPGCVGRDRVRAKHGIDASAPDQFTADRVLVVVEPVRVVVHGR